MKKPGNITVFTALCLMLIASFLFALLEAGRVRGLYAYADMKSQMGLESVCAEYQRALWEEYDLLCLDGSYGKADFSMEYVTDVLKRWIDKNLFTKGTAGNLLSMQLVKAEPEKYELLTDGEGAVFFHRIAENMKENLPLEMAQALYDRYKEGADAEDNTLEGNPVEEARTVIEDAKKSAQEETYGESNSVGSGEKGHTEGVRQDKKSAPSQENPLDIVLALKQNAVLGMVADVNNISRRGTDFSNGLMNRNCESGTWKDSKKAGWYEKVLVLEYLGRHFSDYTRPVDHHALAYEMEYIIGGKDTDRENLETVVERLLLLREAANVTHIIGDSVKRNQVGAIASSLAGFTGNPVVVKVVETGIIAAWAYLESVQDLRALLQGDKIAFIKSREQWTVDIENLAESFQSTSKARNCDNGFTYQEYLKQLLSVLGTKQLAYRAMDVMEQNIRLVQEYKNCRMDHMISRADYCMKYTAEPFFAGFAIIGGRLAESFEIVSRADFSYERK